MTNTIRFIKFLLILLFCILICHQFSEGEGIEAFKNIWKENKQNLHFHYLFLLIILMPLNWWIEVLKWQKLMSPHLHISTYSSIKTVLAGVSAGIVTPARIGEYAGRLITSDPEFKTQVISATLLGSIAQNLCNIFGGLYFSYFFLNSVFHVTNYDQFTFIAIVVLQISLLLILYYNLPKVAHFIEKKAGHKFIIKYCNQLKSLDLYKRNILNSVLVFSLIRYSIYFLQYFLIMKFFGSSQSLIALSGGISIIYLIQTGLPLPAFLGVFARAEIAVMIWSELGILKIVALAATFSLWFVNLIVPGLAGTIFLYNTDLNKYLKDK